MPALSTPLATLVENLTSVVTAEPLAAVLLAIGVVLILASVGVLGALTLGALVDLVTPG